MDSKTEVTIDAAAKNNLAAAQFAETNAKLLKEGIFDGSFKYLDINRDTERDLVIPTSINRIGNYAMFGYHNVSAITISPNIKEIGVRGFGDCISLKHLEIPWHINRIEPWAFEGNDLNYVNIESIDVIKKDALADGKYSMGYESIVISIRDLGRMEDQTPGYITPPNADVEFIIRPGGYLGDNCVPYMKGSSNTAYCSLSVGEGATIGKNAFGNLDKDKDVAITFLNLSLEEIMALRNYPFGMENGITFYDKDGAEHIVGQEV